MESFSDDRAILESVQSEGDTLSDEVREMLDLKYLCKKNKSGIPAGMRGELQHLLVQIHDHTQYVEEHYAQSLLAPVQDDILKSIQKNTTYLRRHIQLLQIFLELPDEPRGEDDDDDFPLFDDNRDDDGGGGGGLDLRPDRPTSPHGTAKAPPSVAV